MCILGFRWDPGGPVPLQVAGNRDEAYDRPAAPLAWWPGGRLLGGRDLRDGGTWLAVDRRGRLAAVTNFRLPGSAVPGAPSRGQLPVAFLEGDRDAAAFLEDLAPRAAAYSPFNLLLFDGADLLGFESRTGRRVAFSPGCHGVSNGAFDEPWPKLEALRSGLAAAEDDAALLELLAQDRPYPDARLPRTGVPLEVERALSPAFVRLPAYGTRASTLVRLGRTRVEVLERTFSAAGPEGDRTSGFDLAPGRRGVHR